MPIIIYITLCLSLMPLSIFLNSTVTRFCSNKKNDCIQFCIQTEPNSLWTWQWRNTMLTVGNPIRIKQKMGAWTQSQKHKTYNHSSMRQKCYKFFHWHSHNNIHPTTDSWTVPFPTSCSSDTHRCTQWMLLHGPQTAL